MNSKLKDILLYSFAAIGVCSLFIAATNSPQQTTSTVPESHVWESITSPSNNDTFIFNKKTGVVYSLGNGIDKSGVMSIMTIR
tara:strand:- start:198 stop:446 length:249 start_codon:yes stop_codon:yes gene_type:complete